MLSRISRLSIARQKGIKTQDEFERLIDKLASMRLEKVIQYGEDRYHEDDLEFNLWMCYSDVYRKHIRLRQLTRDAAKGGEVSPALIDAYRDMANYAIMALQVLERKQDDKV